MSTSSGAGAGDGLTIYSVGGIWKWAVAGPTGEPLADSAASRADQAAAERDVAATLEALLWADLPATRIRVAHYLSGLDRVDRQAILRHAEEIVHSRRHVDREPVERDDHPTTGGSAR